MERIVHGARYPWGELSMEPAVHGRADHGARCHGASYPGASFDRASCRRILKSRTKPLSEIVSFAIAKFNPKVNDLCYYCYA
jgi:hypothetical protein